MVSHMRPDQRIQCTLQVQARFSLCPSSSFLSVLLAFVGFDSGTMARAGSKTYAGIWGVSPG